MIFHFVSISEYHHVAIISNLASGYQKFLEQSLEREAKWEQKHLKGGGEPEVVTIGLP